MGNELGKMMADGFERLTRKAAPKLPERQAAAAIKRGAAEVYGRDTLLRSVAKPPAVDGVLTDALPKAAGTKPVTFLTYSASDNELSEFVPKHLNNLERVGTNDAVNVLAFTDRDGMNDTRRYLISKDAKPATVSSAFEKVGTDGELDMSNPESLKAAVAWARTNYPGKLTWLDANNHGAGYYGLFQDKQSLDPMRLPQIAQAVLDGNGGKPVDLLTVDACEMQAAEFNYEMRRAARVIVGSSDETFPMGMNYDKTLAALSKNPTDDPIALGKLVASNVQLTGKDMVEAGDGPGVKRVYHVAVTDTSKAEAMAKAVDELSGSLMTALDTRRPQVVDAIKGVKKLYVANHGGYDWNMRDLPSLAEALKNTVDDPAVKASADKVLAATTGPGGLVVQTAAAEEEAGATRGVTIYLPLDGKIDPIYKDTAFAKDTRWAQFLEKLGPTNAPPAVKK